MILPDIKTAVKSFEVSIKSDCAFFRHVSFNQNIMRVLPGTLPEQLKTTRLITVDPVATTQFIGDFHYGSSYITSEYHGAIGGLTNKKAIAQFSRTTLS